MSASKDREKEMLRQSAIFNISTYAKSKVQKKRDNKGPGDLKPRDTNPYKLFLQYTVVGCAAKTLFAPLERLRILQQTSHMVNLNSKESIRVGGSIGTLSSIVSDQGV